MACAKHDVCRVHFGAIHGHMEIVVTEFFTAEALQHFHVLGRIVSHTYSATACTKGKCCFSVSSAPEYLILDLSNHLAAAKPSCKTVCFWGRM